MCLCSVNVSGIRDYFFPQKTFILYTFQFSFRFTPLLEKCTRVNRWHDHNALTIDEAEKKNTQIIVQLRHILDDPWLNDSFGFCTRTGRFWLTRRPMDGKKFVLRLVTLGNETVSDDPYSVTETVLFFQAVLILAKLPVL